MRLGLTSSSYQYLFAGGGQFPDRTALTYNLTGQPYPYFTRTPVRIDPSQQLVWLIERCAALGVAVCHASITRWDDLAYLDDIRDLLARYHLDLIPSLGVELISTGDRARQAIDDAVATLERYRAFGGIMVCKYCTMPMIHTRFTTRPPLNEQLALIVEHSQPIVAAAAAAGITLAFENHLDYRASEIVQVIEAVNSPYLRFLFDTGNPLAVCEDPVEAAACAAPYTVLVHLKDVRVVPWTPGQQFVSALFAAPLGRGHVENRQILEILQAQAPDPGRLCLSLELMPVPPNEDEDFWVEASIAYAKEEFAAFLSEE